MEAKVGELRLALIVFAECKLNKWVFYGYFSRCHYAKQQGEGKDLVPKSQVNVHFSTSFWGQKWKQKLNTCCNLKRQPLW